MTLSAILADGLAQGRYLAAAAGRRRHGHTEDLAGIGADPMAARFDVASLTKIVATTSMVAVLVERGDLAVDDPLARFGPSPHESITLRHLLTHRAGLWEWQPLYFLADDLTGLPLPDPMGAIASLPLRYPIDAARHYSDLSMILLGEVIARVTGSPLAQAFTDLVAAPVGLTGSGYRPRPHGEHPGQTDADDLGDLDQHGDREDRDDQGIVETGDGDAIEERMIATGSPYPVFLPAPAGGFAFRRGRLRGEVADGNAWHAMGGVSGHAGLFMTLPDLLRLGSAWLGPPDGPDLLGPQTRALFLGDPDSGCVWPDDQALGWRVLPPTGPNSGSSRGSRERTGPAFWHGGFTGCRLLIEPATGTTLALVSNRIAVGEPESLGDVEPTWQRILDDRD